METRNQLFSAASKAGLIIGAAGIILFILMYVSGFKPVGFMLPIFILLIGIALNVLILVMMLKKYCESQDGLISFVNAFLFGLTALVVSSFVVAIFNYLFINYFDPDYMKNIMMAQKDWMENYLSGKASEEQIQAALDGIDQQTANSGSILQALKGLGGNIIFGGIIALIVGAIMKKNPDIFDNANSGGVI